MKPLSIIIFSLIITSCLHKTEETKSPLRVKGIPEKAFWIGGVDGGNWYLIDDIHDHRNSAFIKVYNDNDGSLIISKRFHLICHLDNQMLIENLQNQISGFDGGRIHLKSSSGKRSCYLQ